MESGSHEVSSASSPPRGAREGRRRAMHVHARRGRHHGTPKPARWSSRGAYSRTSGHTRRSRTRRSDDDDDDARAFGLGGAIGNRRVSGAPRGSRHRAQERDGYAHALVARRRSGARRSTRRRSPRETGEGGGGETGVGRSHGGVQARFANGNASRCPGMTRGERERERERCVEKMGRERWRGSWIRHVSSRFGFASSAAKERRERATSRTAVRPAPSFVLHHTPLLEDRPTPPHPSLHFSLPELSLEPVEGKGLIREGLLGGLIHPLRGCTNRRGPPGRRPGASPPRSPPRCERAPGPARARVRVAAVPVKLGLLGELRGEEGEERRSEHDRRGDAHIEERRGSNGVCVQRVGFSRVVRAGRSRVLGRVLGFRGAPPTRGPRARGRASPCPRVPPSSRRSGARHPPARRGGWETGRSYEYLVDSRARETTGVGSGWDGPASGARSPPASADPRRERREGRGHRCRL